MVMYHLDNGQRSYKSQTKHVKRMILPSSSQKYERTFEYAGAEKRWNSNMDKILFHCAMVKVVQICHGVYISLCYVLMILFIHTTPITSLQWPYPIPPEPHSTPSLAMQD